ncbi:uncharacterized protein LOC135372688 isoform X2 [Ornithodoros turicata]|uniref:uncharacterized protein LOC135372688 isoform X2 n=1 Tax=Ornithodoros turicata TaxID=34597 RepID=UPI003139EE2F
MDRQSFDQLRTRKDLSRQRLSHKSHHSRRPTKESAPKIEAPQTQSERKEERSAHRRKKIAVPITAAIFLGTAFVGLFLYWRVWKQSSVARAKHCTNKACKLATAQYEAMLNATFAPCDDFYMYACGGWLARESRKTSYVEDIYATVSEDAHTLLYGRNIGTPDRDPFWNLVTFYRSCYDFRANQDIAGEAQRAKRYLETAEWPRDDAYTLLETLIRLSLAKGIPTVFDIYIRPWREFGKPPNTTKHFIFVRLGESISKMIAPTSEEFLPKILKPYINSILDAVPHDLSDDFVNNLIEFEHTFQKLSKESRKSEKVRLGYRSFPAFPPQLQWRDWRQAIQRSLLDPGKVEDEPFVYNMSALTNVTNRLFIVDSMLRVSYVSLLAITNVLRYRFQGEMSQDTCVRLAMEHFPVNTIYLLSEKRIVPTLQDTFTMFVKGIQSQVIKEVAKATWMTKNHLQAITNMINALDLVVPETLPPLLSRDVPPMSSEFTKNYVLISNYTRALENKYLEFRTSFSQLLRASVQIEEGTNDLGFTNAIMWKPWFYDQKEDTYINYATVGVRTGIALFKFVLEEYMEKNQSQVNGNWKSDVTCMLRQTRLLLQRKWSESSLGAAYAATRGTSVALGLASPFPDINAKRLFFGRLCQQYCDQLGNSPFQSSTDYNQLNPRLLCEVAVRQHPLFWEAFGCWNFKGNCSIM